MALGGGSWVTQNKKLVGSYINFISAKGAASVLGERGVAALPLSLNWCAEGEVLALTSEEFYNNGLKVLGYNYTAEAMKGLRDLFKNATKVFIYRLNTGGTKASNTYATAKHPGTRGNDIKIAISDDVDVEGYFIVRTLVDNKEIDAQSVKQASELNANDFVDWKTDAELNATTGVSLAGGTNGTVDGDAWSKALSSLERFTFNTLGVISTDDTIKSLAAAWTKRMRNEMGVKFQTVVYNHLADEMGVINVINKLNGENTTTETANIVYWVTGAQAGCAVNKSCTNKKYDGEYEVDTKYTQSELISAVDNGKLVFHLVGDDVRVLEDINSKTTISEEEGEVFKSNQTVRVIDQIGNDIAGMFNTRFLGVIPNDEAGRVSLQNEIVRHHKALQDIRAIENFSADDVKVEPGNSKKSVVVVDNVTVVNAMAQLYMTVVVA